jgi:hypothetical protein
MLYYPMLDRRGPREAAKLEGVAGRPTARALELAGQRRRRKDLVGDSSDSEVGSGRRVYRGRWAVGP